MKKFVLSLVALILLSACANSPTPVSVSPTDLPALTPTPLGSIPEDWDPFAFGYYDSSKLAAFAADENNNVVYTVEPAAYIQFIVQLWNDNSAVISFPLAPDQKGGLVDGVFDLKDALIFNGVDHSNDKKIGGINHGTVIVYGIDPQSRPDGFALVDNQGHQLSSDQIDPTFAYQLSLVAYSLTHNYFLHNDRNMAQV
jgi:hypothetical protein